MTIDERFRGKGCVVTGAASGIGYAIAEALLRAGADVVLADRDAETLAAAVGELAAHAGRARAAHVDVTIGEQVAGLLRDAAARHGRLDYVFNNAGIGCTMLIGDATLEHWRRLIEVNLWGVIYGVHAAIPIMRRQGGGHIVTTSSIAGLIPFPFQALYCATKYAVVGMSESLRFELADEGIHFSVVCPADVATRIYGTPIIGERREVKPPAHAISADEAAREILAGVANREGIIILPESARQMWLQYRTSQEASETFLMEMARQRRESFRTTGSYY
ncbi:MAG: SDR family NAD(P)-dependent oxidoreductase [bacterium]|nr:SDR family NAD(P)-dependent oxidoreductase [bacterium]